MAKDGKKVTENPVCQKDVKDTISSANSFYKLVPTWSFRYCDFDHEQWGIQANSTYLPKLISRMRDWELGTWGDLLTVTSGRSSNTQSHEIEATNISKEAKKRLVELGHNTVEISLYSLSVIGKQRVWGIVDSESGVFHLIWFDPKHEIYKVTPRGT